MSFIECVDQKIVDFVPYYCFSPGLMLLRPPGKSISVQPLGQSNQPNFIIKLL